MAGAALRAREPEEPSSLTARRLGVPRGEDPGPQLHGTLPGAGGWTSAVCCRRTLCAGPELEQRGAPHPRPRRPQAPGTPTGQRPLVLRQVEDLVETALLGTVQAAGVLVPAQAGGRAGHAAARGGRLQLRTAPRPRQPGLRGGGRGRDPHGRPPRQQRTQTRGQPRVPSCGCGLPRRPRRAPGPHQGLLLGQGPHCRGDTPFPRRRPHPSTRRPGPRAPSELAAGQAARSSVRVRATAQQQPSGSTGLPRGTAPRPAPTTGREGDDKTRGDATKENQGACDTRSDTHTGSASWQPGPHPCGVAIRPGAHAPGSSPTVSWEWPARSGPDPGRAPSGPQEAPPRRPGARLLVSLTFSRGPPPHTCPLSTQLPSSDSQQASLSPDGDHDPGLPSH